MRWIHVIGDSLSANALRVALREQGFAVTSEGKATFTIALEERVGEMPIMDSLDGPIEREIFAAVRAKTPSGQVLVQHAGGVQATDEIRIIVPPSQREREACVSGVVVGLLEYLKNIPLREAQARSWRHR